MKMKSVLTVFALLALCSAPALAAGPGPVHQAKQRIEQKAAGADKICRDKRLGPKTKSKQICSRYGICNNNVSCSQAVKQWKDRSLANLKNSPAAKKTAPPPPQGYNSAPPPPPPGQNHVPPQPPPGQPGPRPY